MKPKVAPWASCREPEGRACFRDVTKLCPVRGELEEFDEPGQGALRVVVSSADAPYI